MGALSLPASGVVYVDANVAIYSVDRHPTYSAVCDPLWQAAQSGDLPATSSDLTLLEVHVGPLGSGDTELAARREALWRRPNAHLLPMTHTVLHETARLRAATHGPRTPDAIHATTAIVHGCALFVTNDTGFRGVPALPLAILDDVLAGR